MKKKYTFLIIIGLITFPFILIPVIIFLFEYLTKNSPEYLAIITLDLYERITVVEFTALYIPSIAWNFCNCKPCLFNISFGEKS